MHACCVLKFLCSILLNFLCRSLHDGVRKLLTRVVLSYQIIGVVTFVVFMYMLARAYVGAMPLGLYALDKCMCV